MNFQQTLLRNFKVKICKKKIAQEIEFLRREQLLPINISTLCLFKRLFIRALGQFIFFHKPRLNPQHSKKIHPLPQCHHNCLRHNLVIRFVLFFAGVPSVSRAQTFASILSPWFSHEELSSAPMQICKQQSNQREMALRRARKPPLRIQASRTTTTGMVSNSFLCSSLPSHWPHLPIKGRNNNKSSSGSLSLGIVTGSSFPDFFDLINSVISLSWRPCF